MQGQEAEYTSITEIDKMVGDEEESSNTNSESEQTGTNTTPDCRSRSTSLEIIEKYNPRLAKDKIEKHGSAGSNSIVGVMRISKLAYTQAQDTLIFLRFQQLQKMSLETGGPGCGLDPFNNLGLSSDRSTHVAIDHWTSGVQKTRTPMSPRPAWFRTSIADPVILAATVAASTSHLLFCQGAIKSTPAYISHKVRAIQAINKNLDSPESASDYTIMAVAMMAIIEGLAGAPAACAIHRQGLGQLVRSRGGLKTLGLNGIAARTVSWADTACSIVLRSPPRLHPNLASDTAKQFADTRDPLDYSSIISRLHSLTDSSPLSQCLAAIWFRLLDLSVFLSTIPPTETWQLDEMLFSDKIDLIERQVLHVLHSPTLANNPIVAFITAFLNAALIYSYQDLREVPSFSNICISLSERIHSGLQLIDLSSIATTCPDLLLWTILLGRSAAPLGTLPRSWFSGVLTEMSHLLGKPIPESLQGLSYFELAALPSRESP